MVVKLELPFVDGTSFRTRTKLDIDIFMSLNACNRKIPETIVMKPHIFPAISSGFKLPHSLKRMAEATITQVVKTTYKIGVTTEVLNISNALFK